MPIYPIDVAKMNSAERTEFAKDLASVSIPAAVPCQQCGSSDLRAWHQFGAMVICAGCGENGPFVPGKNHQDEQRNAVNAWNSHIAACGKQGAK